MKKALLFILALGLLLTSCGEAAPGEPLGEEVITEPEVLQKFWEDYLDDAPFTLTSSFTSWHSPEEIEPLSLCNYLFLKMQRNDDLEGTNIQDVIDGKSPELIIKADKLLSYHERYFAEMYDYRKVESSGCFYDPNTDSVVMSVGYLIAQLPEVNYDQFEEYPHFALESLTLDHSEGTATAKVGIADYRLPSPDPENKIYDLLKFEMAEDGSFRLISSNIDFTPMKGSYMKGESQKLPYIDSLGSFTTTGPAGDILPLFAYDAKGLKFSSVNIKTGEFKDIDIIPLISDHSESSVILRNGHIMLIETSYNLLPDGNIDTKEPDVVLSELYLTGSERRMIELPENCAYISDISPDLNKMLYKEKMDGDFIVYDFTTKSSTPIVGTAPQIPDIKDENDIFNIEAFGHGRFSFDGSSVVLFKFGYEWGAGYAVYDIATGALMEHQVKTVWGGYPIMTPSGLYIGGIADEGNSSYAHGFLKFNEGEIQKLPSTPFPENFQYSYVPNGENRFIVMLMPVNEEEYRNVPASGLTEMAAVVFDSETLETRDTGARIKRAPYSQCSIFLLDDGSIYISDGNVSQENAYLIENPFLK